MHRFLSAGESQLTAIQLCRMANQIRRHIEATVLQQEGLRWTAFELLHLLRARHTVETRDAAKRLGLAKTTLSGHVAELVKRGLVRRVSHPDDGRRVVLLLTQTGQRLAEQAVAAVRAEEEQILRGIGPSLVVSALRTAAGVLRG